MSETLTAVQEDYVESILALIRDGQVARVRDIARSLGVGMPSVTAALKSLAKRKLVNYEAYQFITLTDRGRELAEEVRQRHEVIRHFLTEVLGLDRTAADANACRMEHGMDEQVLERLRLFNEFVGSLSRPDAPWENQFQDYCNRSAASSPAANGQAEADGKAVDHE